jgi:Nucleoside 2-deoxyribosyltransferase like
MAHNGDVLISPDNLRLVYAGDPLPGEPSVFLAGPTPRSDDVPSWRPDAVKELSAQWRGPGQLAVLLPQPPGGQRWPYFDEQAEWETVAREAATAILFWIPRDVRTLPGFTTNVEFGLDVTTGRAVLGCPPDCPSPERNRYLIWLARRHGVPVTGTLSATVTSALALIAQSA